MDIKNEIIERAEAVARDTYGCGFYELPQDRQDEVWNAAEASVKESLLSLGDGLKKMLREAAP